LRCTARRTGNTTDSVGGRDWPVIRQTDPAYSWWNILIVAFVAGLEWIRVFGEWSRCCRLPNRASALMVIARAARRNAARRCAIMVFHRLLRGRAGDEMVVRGRVVRMHLFTRSSNRRRGTTVRCWAAQSEWGGKGEQLIAVITRTRATSICEGFRRACIESL
jgi:hypothetical protein